MAIALAVLLAYSRAQEWLLQENERDQRIGKAVNPLWMEASRGDAPTFVFELRRLEQRGSLKGGSIELDHA